MFYAAWKMRFSRKLCTYVWLLGVRPQTSPGVCPWTPTGDFRPLDPVRTLSPNPGYATAIVWKKAVETVSAGCRVSE